MHIMLKLSCARTFSVPIATPVMSQRVKSAEAQSAPSMTARDMFASVNLLRLSVAHVRLQSCMSQRQNELSLASEKEKRARVSTASSNLQAMSSLEEKLASEKFPEEKSTLRRVMLVAVSPMHAALFTSAQLQVCAPLQCDTLQRVKRAWVMMLPPMFARERSAAVKLHIVKLQLDKSAALSTQPSNTAPSSIAPAKLASPRSMLLQFVNRISLFKKAISDTGTAAPCRRAPPTNEPANLLAEKSHLDRFALSNLQFRRLACSKLQDTGSWR